jgi:hypothetical protein
MTDNSTAFPYSADRSNHTGTVIAWIFLMLVEGVVLLVLIFVFAHSWWLRLPLLAGMAGLLLWAINRINSTADTSHRLDGEALHLHYGAELKVTIPRQLLVSARPV